MGDFQSFCKDNFAMQAALSEATSQLDASVVASREESNQGLQDLRKYAAAESEFRELQDKFEECCKNMQSDFFKDRQEIDLLKVQLHKDQNFNTSTFATKIMLQEDVNKLKEEKEVLE